MRLTGNVLLRDPQDGSVVFVEAGEEVPGWAERLVGDHLVDKSADEPKATPRKPRAKVAKGRVRVEDDADEGSDDN